MARPAPLIDLTDEQRTVLEGLARRRETAHRLVRRARIVRRAAAGEPNQAIGHALDLDEDGVGPWRRRWANAQDPLAALASHPQRLRAAIEELLSDRPRSGNPGDFSAEQICQIIALACETPQGGTVLAKIHCFAVRLSSTLDNSRQHGYQAPE